MVLGQFSFFYVKKNLHLWQSFYCFVNMVSIKLECSIFFNPCAKILSNVMIVCHKSFFVFNFWGSASEGYAELGALLFLIAILVVCFRYGGFELAKAWVLCKIQTCIA